MEQGLGVANALQGSHKHPTTADNRPRIRVNITIVPRSTWCSDAEVKEAPGPVKEATLRLIAEGGQVHQNFRPESDRRGLRCLAPEASAPPV